MRKSRDEKYLAISDALLTTAMLSNDLNEEYAEDVEKIVNFIGEVYSLPKEHVDKYIGLICDELTMLSTKADIEAYMSDSEVNSHPELNKYLYLKSEALLKIENIHESKQGAFNHFFFDYEHVRPYYREVRFNELESSSLKGDVDITRTVAIMLALGIGCEKDEKAAIYRFKQCVLWSDVSSLYYLAFLYKEKGDEKNAQMYSELIELTPCLFEGRTVVPEEIKPRFLQETINEFNLITSIKHDVVIANKVFDIDFSFVEVILMDKIDYYTKMKYVNEYHLFEWKEVTNPSANPAKRLGFTLKGDK